MSLSRHDELEPTPQYREMMRSIYGSANKGLDRDFRKMSFGKLAESYMDAIHAINELCYIEGGEYMIEARCDQNAKKAKEVLKDMRQYIKDIENFYRSLKSKAAK